MAEDDAETAFLQAQAESAGDLNYEALGNQDGADSGSDDYDPSSTMTDSHVTNIAESNLNSAADASFNSPSAPLQQASRSPSQDFSQALHNSGTHQPSATPISQAEPKDSASHPKSVHSVQPEEEASGDNANGEEAIDKGDADYEPPAPSDFSAAEAHPPEHSLSENANENVYPYNVPQQEDVSQKNIPFDDPNKLPPSGILTDAVSKLIQDESRKPTHDNTQPPDDSAAATPPVTEPGGRLPHDRVGILEDRIQADPRGDTDAWLSLIEEHRSRNKFDSAREVYERFFKIFPTAGETWVSYANMESQNNELYRLEQIFNRSLLTVPNVKLWSAYLDYVRRRNNLTTDTSGQARSIITSAYDFALQNVGADKDSSQIWQDYIDFIRSGPGNVGGTGWQDQQKMDILRRAYQRAICVPMQAVNLLWKEYDQFEMGLNKLTGRKFLQERSPAYMTARSSYTELQNITRDLDRVSLPRLPPFPGFAGYDYYCRQVDIWRKWTKWEVDDPLVFKEDEPGEYRSRVLYVYKQALMFLRFFPEMWFEAANFCFENSMENEGIDLLRQGMEANPENCLLAFKLADRIELMSDSEQDSQRRGAKVREVYDKVLHALYELVAKTRAQEARGLEIVEETFGNLEVNTVESRDDDDEGLKARAATKTARINRVKKDHATLLNQLSKTISYIWIGLMRSMRRIQGKGKPGEIAGSRQVFADARKRGRITSDVYIASALIEHHCYKDPAATKIFERGSKLFPDDEVFALEYLKHLIDINDITNARAVFETSTRRLTANPDNVVKAKPLFLFMHNHESRYGDMVQITNIESKMRELFPEDSNLKLFCERFSAPSFNPVSVALVLSPSQIRPPSVEGETLQQAEAHQRFLSGPTDSPKRPFSDDDYDEDRPRKMIRAESPLKSATSKKRGHQANGSVSNMPMSQIPPPLPRDIMLLLSIIPGASSYDATRFSPEKMVALLRHLDIPQTASQLHPVVASLPAYPGVYAPGA